MTNLWIYSICVCVCVCVRVCVCVYTYVCMYVCTYTCISNIVIFLPCRGPNYATQCPKSAVVTSKQAHNYLGSAYSTFKRRYQCAE